MIHIYASTPFGQLTISGDDYKSANRELRNSLPHSTKWYKFTVTIDKEDRVFGRVRRVMIRQPDGQIINRGPAP